MMAHDDLDMGTFVLDAMGVRWANDPGMESYSAPGYFDQAAGRWVYYKKRAEGHNTLVINPDSGPDQNINAYTKILNYQSGQDNAFVIGDITSAYKDAMKVHRGVQLLNHRTQVVVQDEIQMMKPSEIYWFMMTGAVIQISNDGKSAVLMQNGKKLLVKILPTADSQDAKFSILPTTPLPTSPQAANTPIVGMQRLTIHMQNVLSTTISVAFMPLLQGQDVPTSEPTVVPLSSWSLAPQTGIKANAITVNGQTVSGFDPRTLDYTVSLPVGTKNIPDVEATAPEGYDVSVKQADILPGYAFVTVKSKTDSSDQLTYSIYFNKLHSIGLPVGITPYNIVGVTASDAPQANQGYTPDKTIDNDLSTRWSASGQVWIQYDLGESKEVGNVAIALYAGDQRYTVFDIDVSQDGINWTKAFAGQSSGTTTNYELYDLASYQARYVRIIGYGNSISSWNSITEVKIYLSIPSVDKVTVSADKSAIKPGDTLQLSAAGVLDNGSQLDLSKATVVYTSDNEQVLKVDNAGLVTAIAEGTANVKAAVTYNSVTKEGSIPLIVDGTAPVTTETSVGTVRSDGSYNSHVTVTFAAADAAGGSGVAKTEYSFDGTNWLAYTAPFTLTDNGIYNISYKSTDNAGNVETAKMISITVAMSPDVMTAYLIAKVGSMGVDNGTANSLASKLDGAKDSFLKGDKKSPVNQLNAFVNEVDAQSGKKITADQANDLKTSAEKIIATIN
jgi:hypothetical protein